MGRSRHRLLENAQQVRAVYKKAGLTGRNDLAAFFLEDLLPGVPSAGQR